jgi:sugar phosphate isomerase/epimerase
MRHTTRKEFLQTSSVLLLGAAFAKTPFDFKKEKLPLAFSTLACPDWDFKKITDYAVKHEYTGIELRGLKREINLPKCPEFSSTKNIDAVLKIMKDKKLRFVDLGSSSTLHFREGAEREKNINDGKAFIDLAQQLNCPNVRVYPNLLPKDKDKDETMDFIVKGLLELGKLCESKRSNGIDGNTW